MGVEEEEQVIGPYADRLFPHSLPLVMGFSPVFRLILQRRNPVSRRGGSE